jgi:hypothetical protein
MLKKEKDQIAEQARRSAEMAANSARSQRTWSGLGTGGGVS